MWVENTSLHINDRLFLHDRIKNSFLCRFTTQAVPSWCSLCWDVMLQRMCIMNIAFIYNKLWRWFINGCFYAMLVFHGYERNVAMTNCIWIIDILRWERFSKKRIEWNNFIHIDASLGTYFMKTQSLKMRYFKSFMILMKSSRFLGENYILI